MSWGGFGSAVDAVSMLAQLEQAENRQNDAQQFAIGSQTISQDFNSAQAVAQRDWSERMSNTQYQRGIKDMEAAGLNPMMAVRAGGAGTPSGASASSSAGSAGIASPGGGLNTAASYEAMTRAEVNVATKDKTEAETANIKAQTPTHAVNIDRMKQEITESVERIKKIQQETNTSAYSAANLYQNTQNLMEEIPRIQETVKLLRQQTEKTGSENQEITQRIKAQLPQLQAALDRLEALKRNMALPGHRNDEAAQEHFLGTMGAYLRAINPLVNLFK